MARDGRVHRDISCTSYDNYGSQKRLLTLESSSSIAIRPNGLVTQLFLAGGGGRCRTWNGMPTLSLAVENGET
jgi:hypothetical protein